MIWSQADDPTAGSLHIIKGFGVAIWSVLKPLTENTEHSKLLCFPLVWKSICVWVEDGRFYFKNFYWKADRLITQSHFYSKFQIKLFFITDYEMHSSWDWYLDNEYIVSLWGPGTSMIKRLHLFSLCINLSKSFITLASIYPPTSMFKD